MPQPRTGRWLDLVAFLLQHRFPVTREEIFANVSGYLPTRGSREPTTRQRESARRKFERDKDDLRALGIEIETVALSQGEADDAPAGYRLRPHGFYLPYLELAVAGSEGADATDRPYAGLARVILTADEARVLDRATRRLAQRDESPLAQAAASARRKLAFDLPLDDAAIERVLGLPLPEQGRRALAVLQSAVRDHVPVRCRYHGVEPGRVEEIEIEPWGLVFDASHWHCIGKTSARASEDDSDTVEGEPGVRMLRVDRMEEARATGGPAFSVPVSLDVRDYLGLAPWQVGAGPVATVRVEFAFPESRRVLNQRWGRAVEPLTDDGGAVIEFDVRDRDHFLRWLLSLGARATVREPAALAQELRELRRQVADLYA